MFKKTITLFLFLIVSPLFMMTSCFLHEDECGPFSNHYKVTGFETALKKIAISENASFSFNLNELESDSVSFTELAIRLLPKTEMYQAKLRSKQTISLFPNAYACSPPPLTSDETITDIQIFSSKNYNDEFSSTDNIAHLFDIIVLYNKIGYQKFELNEFLTTNPETPLEIILLPKKQPGTPKPLQFTIKYFQDGLELNQFEFTTETVVIS